MFTKLIAAASLAFVGVASATTPVAAAPAAGSATLMVAAAASPAAQDWRYRGDYRRYDRRHWDRGRHRGWDRGRHYRRGYYRGGRTCWREWRFGHRVTVCRRRW